MTVEVAAHAAFFIKRAGEDILRDASRLSEVMDPMVLVDAFALQSFFAGCEKAPAAQAEVMLIDGSPVCVEAQGVLVLPPGGWISMHARGFYSTEAMKDFSETGLVQGLRARTPSGSAFSHQTVYAFTEEALRKGLALRVAKELEGKHAA